MEELHYKQDIIETRTGNVGSSDAKMLEQIATTGQVPKSAYKRMAIIKGLCENPEISTPAMRYGDFVENEVYKHLQVSDSRWQSNPCIVSEKYSRPNCGCLTHVDFLLQDDKEKVLIIGECKGTKRSFDQTRSEYTMQLCHHYLLAKEYAKKLGGYKVRVILCHYSTEGVDLDAPWEFDTSRLTVKYLRGLEKASYGYPLEQAMDIVNDFLESFNFYTEEEEISYDLLPANVQTQFSEVANYLREIKEREAKVEDFKAKLYGFLSERNIKKIACDEFSFTVVQPTESVSVDYKAIFTNEIEKKRPYVARRLKEEYKKTTPRKGYVVVKVNKNDNN